MKSQIHARERVANTARQLRGVPGSVTPAIPSGYGLDTKEGP